MIKRLVTQQRQKPIFILADDMISDGVWHWPYPVQTVDVVPQSFSQSVSVHAFMHGHPVVGQAAHNLQRDHLISF